MNCIMNKKKYQKPALCVNIFMSHATILSGSDPKAYNRLGEGDQFSRQNTGWDDDDDGLEGGANSRRHRSGWDEE
jgi:hypothetical protein